MGFQIRIRNLGFPEIRYLPGVHYCILGTLFEFSYLGKFPHKFLGSEVQSRFRAECLGCMGGIYIISSWRWKMNARAEEFTSLARHGVTRLHLEVQAVQH